MRKTGGIVLGLAVLAVMPATAQETGERETDQEHETAQERETVLDLLGLLADARTGAGWTAALRPHPVVKLDSLLRHHGLDLRAPDPRRSVVRIPAGPRRDRRAVAPRRDPSAYQRIRLEETVRRMERDIERWILRAASGTGSGGAAVAGGTGAAAAPPPGSDATSAEPPVGGGRPR